MTPGAFFTIRVEPRYYKIIILALRHASECLKNPEASGFSTEQLERDLQKIGPIMNPQMAQVHINWLLKELEK